MKSGYKTDLALIISTIVSALYGLLLITSAVKSTGSYSNVIVQSIGIVMGIICMVVISHMDYSAILQLSKYIMGTYVAFLVLVLIIGIGRETTGTNGWISLGPVNVQPSEFAKVGFIITFSYHLWYLGDRIKEIKNVIFLGLHLLIPLALILLQPDYGTAMVFIFIALVMLFYAGLPMRYFVAGGAALVVSAPLLWNFVFSEFQRNRFLVFLNPEASPMDAGYNVMQSKLAVGSGMVSGKGLFEGTQIQLGFLPGKHTDFIFAVAGEELGFLGAMAIILLLGFIICRIFYRASSIRKDSGSFILVGCGAMFLFQTFENIGMNIGLMPVTGIPLPFFSYGGSSILTSFIAIGLILSVIKRKDNI